jgi:hypothetical protein
MDATEVISVQGFGAYTFISAAWTPTADRCLLQGLAKHGLHGGWTAILMDADLALQEHLLGTVRCKTGAELSAISAVPAASSSMSRGRGAEGRGGSPVCSSAGLSVIVATFEQPGATHTEVSTAGGMKVQPSLLEPAAAPDRHAKHLHDGEQRSEEAIADGVQSKGIVSASPPTDAAVPAAAAVYAGPAAAIMNGKHESGISEMESQRGKGAFTAADVDAVIVQDGGDAEMSGVGESTRVLDDSPQLQEPQLRGLHSVQLAGQVADGGAANVREGVVVQGPSEEAQAVSAQACPSKRAGSPSKRKLAAEDTSEKAVGEHQVGSSTANIAEGSGGVRAAAGAEPGQQADTCGEAHGTVVEGVAAGASEASRRGDLSAAKLADVERLEAMQVHFLRRRWALLERRLTREATKWTSSTLKYAGARSCFLVPSPQNPHACVSAALHDASTAWGPPHGPSHRPQIIGHRLDVGIFTACAIQLHSHI